MEEQDIDPDAEAEEEAHLERQQLLIDKLCAQIGKAGPEEAEQRRAMFQFWTSAAGELRQRTQFNYVKNGREAGAFMGGEAEQDPARIALSLREAVEEHMGRAFNRLEITLAGEAEPEVRWFFRG